MGRWLVTARITIFLEFLYGQSVISHMPDEHAEKPLTVPWGAET